METIGEFVKKLREGAGLSREELASKAGIHRGTLFNLETGEGIRFDNLRQIGNALELAENQWEKLIALWVREQVGEADFTRFAGVDAARTVLIQEQAELSEAARALSAKLERLSASDRAELLRAADRPEVIGCVRILNEFCDKVAVNPFEGAVMRETITPSADTASPAATKQKVSYSGATAKKQSKTAAARGRRSTRK